MAALEELEDFVREKIEVNKLTHKELGDLLQQAFPGQKGFSVRSIERFCSDKEISRRSNLSDQELDSIIQQSISQVGPTYGRKTMTGYLSSQGIHVSQQRIGESLSRVSPLYHHARNTATARLMNPIPYKADYPGHKLHIDQNEKLVMYGVTHIAAIDGFSGMIVGFITLPVKNNVDIYTNLYLPIVSQYGLWDQIRVDHGKEWILMLFVQERLAHLRRNTSRPPHLQSTSKQNHCVERIWVEINGRINYPIKACLIALEEAGDLNMDCHHTRYCVSWFTIHVSNVGITMAVNAWNNHPIPGSQRGIPLKSISQNNQAVKIDPALLPDRGSAIQQFEENGGTLTIFSCFAEDPLSRNAGLVSQREARFYRRFPDFSQFFYTVVNGDFTLFREGILCLIDISKQLESAL